MPSPEPPAQNRGIGVFVSSTFRDMMGERDELMAHELRGLPTVPTADAVPIPPGARHDPSRAGVGTGFHAEWRALILTRHAHPA